MLQDLPLDNVFTSFVCPARSAEGTLNAFCISFRNRLASKDTTLGSATTRDCNFPPTARRAARDPDGAAAELPRRDRLAELRRTPPTSRAATRLRAAAPMRGGVATTEAAARDAAPGMATLNGSNRGAGATPSAMSMPRSPKHCVGKLSQIGCSNVTCSQGGCPTRLARGREEGALTEQTTVALLAESRRPPREVWPRAQPP